MGVKEADPKAKPLDDAFAQAMAAPGKPKEAPPPPEVDREAPHGRDGDGKPLAPYGYTRDGKVRKSAAGRPAKDDKPRTTAEPAGAPADSKPGAAGLEPHDFSAGLMDTGETVWFAGSIAAKIGPQLPVLGRFIPGPKLAATMAVFDAERPRLAAALNLAAQHDARARRLAAKLADGEAGWALSCMFMVAPFTSAVAAIWQTTDQHNVLAERELPPMAELAKRNEEALDKALARITAQMQQAQLTAEQAQLAELHGDDAALNGQVAAGHG
jgi:hypothetical protein